MSEISFICSICEVRSKPGGHQGCNEQHYICQFCYEGDYCYNEKKSPCLGCLNISNFLNEQKCEEPLCQKHKPVLLCPIHSYCMCIKKSGFIKNINCKRCLSIIKKFCFCCFSFKEKITSMHDYHYICEYCKKNTNKKRMACYICKDLLLKSSDCDSKNKEDPSANISSIEESKSPKNNLLIEIPTSLKGTRIKNTIYSYCSLCAIADGIESEYSCESRHLVCGECQNKKYKPDKSKTPCFKCFNLWYNYENDIKCNACKSKNSSVILCVNHSYCHCIRYQPKLISCKSCLKLIEYFCYNCFEFKESSKVHDNHYLCTSCRNQRTLSLLIQDCPECPSILKPPPKIEEIKKEKIITKNIPNNKCSLCLSTKKEFYDWKCIKGHSVCLTCSEGKFEGKNDKFCLECLNAFYNDLVSDSIYSCISCNSLDEKLVRFCPNHIFCPCIQASPRAFTDHQCNNCKRLLQYFCINCFKFTSDTKEIHQKHYVCSECEKKLKTDQKLEMKCQICNSHYKTPINTNILNQTQFSDTQMNLQAYPFQSTNMISPMNYRIPGQSVFPFPPAQNTIISQCRFHSLKLIFTFECSHSHCLQCLLNYLIRKFLKFLLKVQNSDIKWLGTHHKYGCPIKNCKLFRFNYSIYALESQFLELISNLALINPNYSPYLKILFTSFAMFYEGFTFSIRLCRYCLKSTIIFPTPYDSCLNCIQQPLIQYILSKVNHFKISLK